MPSFKPNVIPEIAKQVQLHNHAGFLISFIVDIFENETNIAMLDTSVFNGLNRPTIYHRNEAVEFHLRKRYSFEDFLSHCGNKKSLLLEIIRLTIIEACATFELHELQPRSHAAIFQTPAPV